jgi:galactose mutarotase-like enzyme
MEFFVGAGVVSDALPHRALFGELSARSRRSVCYLPRMAQSAELTLRDEETAAVVTIEPARGGLVTRFDIGERRVLYMDLETLRDPAKNVRGGVPVLFPSPGRLTDDSWTYAGRGGAMRQHGFARNLPWHVTQDAPSAATLRLVASDATFAQYPWDFALEQTLSVQGRSLRLEQKVTNRSDSVMPFGFGFHPYFFVPDAAKRDTSIVTRATRAFDNVSKETISLTAIDLTRPEVDLHLLDHGSTTSELRSPLGRVQLRGSPEYTHWVVWTLAGRDFVCLEPWTCPGNALNDGDRLLLLAPRASRSMSLDIEA